jgi:hypothetical protein
MHRLYDVGENKLHVDVCRFCVVLWPGTLLLFNFNYMYKWMAISILKLNSH